MSKKDRDIPLTTLMKQSRTDKHSAFVIMASHTEEYSHVNLMLDMYSKGVDVRAYFAGLRAACNEAFDELDSAIDKVESITAWDIKGAGHGKKR